MAKKGSKKTATTQIIVDANDPRLNLPEIWEDEDFPEARYDVTGDGDDSLTKEQQADLADLMSGGYDGERKKLPPGVHTLYGYTVTILKLVVRKRKAVGVKGTQAENTDDDEGEAKTVITFSKWSTGKKLKGDERTDRTERGYTIPKDAKTKDMLSSKLSEYFDDKGQVTLGPDMKPISDLFTLLQEVRGQDAYSNEAQAIGRLKYNEFLVLPSDFATPVIPAALVGSGEAIDAMNPAYIIAVYALNKPIHTTAGEAIKFATLRMEAVKLGWYDDQREVRFAMTPDNALEVMNADATEVFRILEEAAMTAWLVPFAAEVTFRTCGHHFITGLASAYIEKYKSILKASLAESCANYLPPEVLFHKALHWISPKRVWNVLLACKTADRVPDAIKIRITLAPAGTAIITTTAAVLNAMRSMGMYNVLQDKHVADVKAIMESDAAIRLDPPKYHKVLSAYGLAGPNADEAGKIIAAKKQAEILAPICQAFVDVMLSTSKMNQQKVLHKYAMASPGLHSAAKKYFNMKLRQKPDKMDDRFEKTIGAAIYEEEE